MGISEVDVDGVHGAAYRVQGSQVQRHAQGANIGIFAGGGNEEFTSLLAHELVRPRSRLWACGGGTWLTDGTAVMFAAK